MPPQKKQKHKISDFRPQENNANRHTERGLWMLDKSISDLGWVGAITVSADNQTFDGSARLETVYSRFGEDVEPIVIDADGTRPIIVRRTDIPTADDEKAVKLAIAANRIAEVDLSWDADMLAEISEEVDLSDLFTGDELSRLLEELTIDPDLDDTEEEKLEKGEGAAERDRYVVPIVLSWKEFQQWKTIKGKLGLQSDKAALLKLMEG